LESRSFLAMSEFSRCLLLMKVADRNRMMDAQRGLYKMCEKKATAMIALEIGGGNGLQGMILGASSNMNLPTVGKSITYQE
jgi:DUF917 family protein